MTHELTKALAGISGVLVMPYDAKGDIARARQQTALDTFIADNRLADLKGEAA
ncbi:MAG: hypothetical protein WBB25_07440 [Sulfitobacter sp.]